MTKKGATPATERLLAYLDRCVEEEALRNRFVIDPKGVLEDAGFLIGDDNYRSHTLIFATMVRCFGGLIWGHSIDAD